MNVVSEKRKARAKGSAFRMLGALRRYRRILVTGHLRPDGDAIGSSVALVLLLESLGIEAALSIDIESAGAPGFLLNGIANIPPGELVSAAPFDAVAVLDSGSLDRIPEHIRPLLDTLPVLNIDHHRTNTGFGDEAWVDGNASSTGEMIYRLARKAAIPLTRTVAEALWVAVVTDTGRFAYDSTRPSTLRMAADLLACGVRSSEINDKIYVVCSKNALALKGRAYSSLETWFGDRVACVGLTADDFRETGCRKSDVEDVVDIPRSVAGSVICLFFYESLTHPGTTRLSIRTRGDYDATRLATVFGGGGHYRAAGCDIPGPLAAAKARVKKELWSWFCSK